METKEIGKKKQHKKTSKRAILGRIKSWGFLAPSFIGVSLFFIIPLCVVIYYSLIDNPISGEFVGLENFSAVIQNKAFATAVHNTIKFSVIAVPLSVVLSLGLAILLDCKLPMRSQLRTFFLSPMMVPVASIVLIWQVLFAYNGAINKVIENFGGSPIDFMNSEHSITVIVVLFLWKNLGYNMILFMAALASIPKDILEVARLESANAFQTFFRIKIRFLSSTILFVTIMSLINSFKIFREVYMLTSDHPFDAAYLIQHFMNNKFKNLDYQVLSSAAILMSLVMIVLIGIMFFVENRFGKDVEG